MQTHFPSIHSPKDKPIVMEIQAPTHQEMTKLISNTLKILLLALAKAASKTSKLILIDLEYLLKRGNSLAQKSLRKFLSLRHNHYTAATALSCRPSDAENYLSTFISPRDYQFSCSSSPIIRRRSKHCSHNYQYNVYHQKHSSRYYNGVSAVEAVDKVLDLLNRSDQVMGNESPELELPGFGKSPIARQLRVTDSPFSLREGVCGDERSGEVDKAAEDFIDKFYNELKMERKNMAAVPAAVRGDRVGSSYNRTWRA